MLDEVIENKRNLLKEGIVYNSNLLENEKDELTLMIESESIGEGLLTDEELKSNLRVFFFAGQSTTTSALSFALYELGKHPEFQQKAREEAISILGEEPTDVIPTMEDTKKMVYINQVLKETLRLHDPVPRVFTRTATEDTILSCGSLVPKGAHVAVNFIIFIIGIRIGRIVSNLILINLRKMEMEFVVLEKEFLGLLLETVQDNVLG
ncbi:unnamed protein product [Mucor hiemalis]